MGRLWDSFLLKFKEFFQKRKERYEEAPPKLDTLQNSLEILLMEHKHLDSIGIIDLKTGFCIAYARKSKTEEGDIKGENLAAFYSFLWEKVETLLPLIFSETPLTPISLQFRGTEKVSLVGLLGEDFLFFLESNNALPGYVSELQYSVVKSLQAALLSLELEKTER